MQAKSRKGERANMAQRNNRAPTVKNQSYLVSHGTLKRSWSRTTKNEIKPQTDISNMNKAKLSSRKDLIVYRLIGISSGMCMLPKLRRIYLTSNFWFHNFEQLCSSVYLYYNCNPLVTVIQWHIMAKINIYNGDSERKQRVCKRGELHWSVPAFYPWNGFRNYFFGQFTEEK